MKRRIAGILTLALLFMTISCLVVKAVSEPLMADILDHEGFTNTTKINSTDVTFPAGRYRITLLAEFTEYHNANVLSHYPASTQEFNVVFTDSEGNFGYVTPTVSRVFTVGSEFGLSIWVTPQYSHFPGDCNHDGEVNMTDAELMRAAWLSKKGTADYDPELDFNMDGVINIKDGAIIGVNWLKKWINRYFTQNSLNVDGQIHSVVYKNLDDSIMYIVGFENAYGADNEEFQDMVLSIRIEPPPPVVPEVPFGTIMTIAGMIAALFGYKSIKRQKRNSKLQ